jgi:hypothetical protein
MFGTRNAVATPGVAGPLAPLEGFIGYLREERGVSAGDDRVLRRVFAASSRVVMVGATCAS